MQQNDLELVEKIVHLNRVAKVVKGGRRFRFSALVVVGDGKGSLGYGLGKANQVPDAIRKATDKAKKNMVTVAVAGSTLPFQVTGAYGAARVLLKPAGAGTGIIAGGPVRAAMEAIGVKNVLTKAIGTNNPHNVIKATIQGLKNMTNPETVSRLRGKTVEYAEVK
ncbi:30S ribosomal protein S5 [Desulfonatronovibrio magnus]|uniref:30S ribosomal protein S5 n=1 Tax=Desulfonatronovibrio magnus TaxID=698827 RepID=UPI0005EB4F12|nr:30S ribosomal protein S5 [Desulfonatronovibrio magnus]